MNGRIAYLSGKEMGIIDGGGARLLESQRIAQYARKSRELERKYEWRSSGAGARFTGQGNPYAGASMRVGAVTALCFSQGGMAYAATFDELGGLYLKNVERPDTAESIVFSERSVSVTDVDAHGGMLAFSVSTARYDQHIALKELNAPGYREITDGDCVDSAPRFSRDGARLYYASAGIGRDENGTFADVGPAAVMELDLKTGELTERFADTEYDFLRPKEDPSGALYLIRRPYASRRQTQSPGLIVRLKSVGAMFRGLGVMLRLMAGKPPKTPAPGAGTSAAASRNINEEAVIDGARLKIESIREANARRGEPYPGVAPEDWVLMRVEAGGLRPVMHGVIDYDFMEDGSLVIANGHYVLLRSPEGKLTKLAEGRLITRVAAQRDMAEAMEPDAARARR